MYSEDEIKGLYEAYRDSISRQKENAIQTLEQQRVNDHANIMANANTQGMMYSNLPERQKIQYDMGTYEPAVVKTQTSYQTGLDTLRNNIVKYQNSIKNIQDAINHLNSL